MVKFSFEVAVASLFEVANVWNPLKELTTQMPIYEMYRELWSVQFCFIFLLHSL